MAQSRNRPREKKEGKLNDHRRRGNAINTTRIFHGALGPARIYRLDRREHVVEGDVLHRRLVVSVGAPVQRAGCPPTVLRYFSQQLREVRHRSVEARHSCQQERQGHSRRYLESSGYRGILAVRPRLFLGRLVTESTTPPQSPTTCSTFRSPDRMRSTFWKKLPVKACAT